MSLVKTLAKVAVGVAVAKAASGMLKGGARAGTPSGQSGGLGGLLEGLTKGASGGSTPYGGPNSPASGGQAGGIEDLLGGLLGGAGGQSGGQSGGLGGLLEQLGGGGSTGGGGGGLGDLLGGLAGAAGGAGGGTFGEIAGALKKAAGGSNDRSFGDVLNSQFEQTEPEPIQPTADQEAAAALMLRAMIQATKADGELDEAEKAKLIDRLGGDVDREEAAFVQAEMRRPVDIEGLARDTPRGMAPQIYAMSVMGIDLDSQAEAHYLHQLAQALGLDSKMVNTVHAQMGVPALYS